MNPEVEAKSRYLWNVAACKNGKGRGTYLDAFIEMNGCFVTSVSILTYELVKTVQFKAASGNVSQFVEIDMIKYLRYSLRQ